jgi:hypothetical protein
MNNVKKDWLLTGAVWLIILIALLCMDIGDLTAKEFTPTAFPYLQSVIGQYEDKPWNINPAPVHIGSKAQQEIVDYAWSASGGDLDFILTLKAENGTFDPNRQSGCKDEKGAREPSFGLCQLHKKWHSAFINSPSFKDWHKQVNYCLKVFERRPGAFYGYYNRLKVKKYFIINPV